jgi:hypothetical protein
MILDRRLNKTTRLVLAVTSLSLAGACSDSSNRGGQADSQQLEAVRDFQSYTWQEVPAGPRWEPRAGLQALELDGRFYVLGGRTPRPPRMPDPVPGDSDIWSDVWVSEDKGETWEKLLDSGGEHWAPRAYFKAVTKGEWLYVVGGQDFQLVELPFCAGQPPEECPPFVSLSSFFNDVWRSRDGVDWERMTEAAPWEGRAGLSVAVLNDELYVMAGSKNDDSAITGGPPLRIYFNDVWKSSEGRQWTRVTAAADWSPRAGAVVVTRGDYLYMLGGEYGFLCDPLPDCEQPYLNDVWRSSDGASWELVTADAGWAPRPGHQCGVIQGSFICFGGFGYPDNPTDVWASNEGATWELLDTPPWNARGSDDIKYDFDIIVTDPYDAQGDPAIYTFGGDRETFDFNDPVNYLRIDDDVWRFAPP